MSSGPKASRQIKGEKVEAMTDLNLMGSKITTEIKTFAPWREIYDITSQCIKKQRHQFAKKGPL